MFTRELNTACCVEIWFGALGTEMMIMECFNHVFMAGQTNIKISCLPLLCKSGQFNRMWYAIKNASLIIDSLSLKLVSGVRSRVLRWPPCRSLNREGGRTVCRCWRRHFTKPTEVWGQTSFPWGMACLTGLHTFVLGCNTKEALSLRGCF